MSPSYAHGFDAVRAAIAERLEGAGIEYRHVVHAPTRTSAESAAARGEPIEIGGKSLLLKVDDTFRTFVLSAALALDSNAVRRHFGTKRTRFATPEELAELSGLVPGCVPPFGEPILPWPLHLDASILDNDRIAFNAGSLEHSFILSVADYRRIAEPVEVGRFSKSAAGR
ncbi:MAG: YbaK/EbsC family protein [Planctomycetota bacterium]